MRWTGLTGGISQVGWNPIVVLILVVLQNHLWSFYTCRCLGLPPGLRISSGVGLRQLHFYRQWRILSFLGCKVVRKSGLKLVLLEYRMDWRKQICCFVKVFSNLFMCMCVHSNSVARLLSFLRSECICFGMYLLILHCVPDTGLDSEDKQINKL